MATLTVRQITRAGVDAATLVAAAGGGDEFQNDGQLTFFKVDNDSGGELTVTFVSQKTVTSLAVADLPVAVAAAGEQLIGPFPADTFNDSDGLVQVTYSGVGSLTVAPFKLR